MNGVMTMIKLSFKLCVKSTKFFNKNNFGAFRKEIYENSEIKALKVGGLLFYKKN